MNRREFLRFVGALAAFVSLPPIVKKNNTAQYLIAMDTELEQFVVGIDAARSCDSNAIMIMNRIGEVYVTRNLWADDIVWERIA